MGIIKICSRLLGKTGVLLAVAKAEDCHRPEPHMAGDPEPMGLRAGSEG